MRRVLALVLVMAMVLSSGITGAFAAITPSYNDSGVADSGGIVSVKITSGAATIVVGGATTTVNVTVGVTKDSGEIPASALKWTSSSENVATISDEGVVTAVAEGTTTITVASAADSTRKDTVTITVTAAPPVEPTKYAVTVTGGTANPTTAAQGETVTITANAPASGKVFDKWTTTDGVTFTDAAKTPTTFTMLEKAVTVVATYKEEPVTPPATKYAVTVTGGTTDKATAAKDEKVTITANPPIADVEFHKWTTTDGVTFENVRNETTTFIMPESAVTVIANYESLLISAAKEKLRELIDTTDKEFLTVHESTNGANVPTNKKWATPAQRVELIKVMEEAKAVNNSVNTKQEAITEISKSLTEAWELFKTQIKSGTKGSSSSSGSSGGSSSGGGTTNTPSVDAPSSNVGGSGEVKSEDIKAETSKAVADAVKAAPGATANVTVKNADNITPTALKEMAAAATAAGGKAQLSADTVVNGVIETRLYINPALAGALKESIKLGVSTNSLEIDATKAKFASFANNIAVASFAQQGSFGMKIQAAVKLDLTTLNTKTLVFYSYDKATNKYIPIVAPAYTIDKNGYLHFSTTVGGDIIITDKALVKK